MTENYDRLFPAEGAYFLSESEIGRGAAQEAPIIQPKSSPRTALDPEQVHITYLDSD